MDVIKIFAVAGLSLVIASESLRAAGDNTSDESTNVSQVATSPSNAIMKLSQVSVSNQAVIGSGLGNGQVLIGYSGSTNFGADFAQLYLNAGSSTTHSGGALAGIAGLLNPQYQSPGGDLFGLYYNVVLGGSGSAEYIGAVNTGSGIMGGFATNLFGFGIDLYMVGGEVKNGVGYFVVNSLEAGAVMDTYRGVWVKPMQLQDICYLTNAYGLYVEGINGASRNNYAIWTGAGKNHLGDLLDLDQTWTIAASQILIGADVVNGEVGDWLVNLRIDGLPKFRVNTKGDILAARNVEALSGIVYAGGFRGPLLYAGAGDALQLSANNNSKTWIIDTAGEFYPGTDDTFPVGVDSNRPKSVTIGTGGVTNSGPYAFARGPMWTFGSGSPEGVVSAPVGSLYTSTDGGPGKTLYVKESGTDKTGWAAK